jgi:metal-dependent amidase/aminoacylase/carboxypeptidase family protein
VLLFQPAEESGAGAIAVVNDPRFARIRPDRVFGLHNLPGHPAGQIVVRDGTFACASRGMIVRLKGATAHAAQPETGLSPAAAMCEIIDLLGRLPEVLRCRDELAFATVVGAKLGDNSFGVAPGAAEIYATLRAETDSGMERLVTHCEKMLRDIAAMHKLGVSIAYEEIFAATMNSAAAVDTIRSACKGLDVHEIEEPFRWSEDFGCLSRVADGAFFGLGAGQDMPQLHNDDYDFPDELVDPGADVFLRIVARCFQEARQ